MSILTLDSVDTGYRDRPIGRNINLRFLPDQVTCLLGSNGCGKTTLLKTILGLLPPLGGKIMVDSRPQHTWSRRQLAQFIAYVPQGHNSLFPFAVRQVVLMGRTAHLPTFATPRRRDHELADECLHTLGIVALADRPYTQLSGGERQLVLIARALAQQPKFLVMDEPTASLDFGNQIRVLEHIAALRSRGLAILFTTHHPGHAARTADRVVLLRGGGIYGVGETAAMLTIQNLAALYDLTPSVVAQNLGSLLELCRGNSDDYFLPL
jgi:iron complex transport system ATP-binding protein